MKSGLIDKRDQVWTSVKAEEQGQGDPEAPHTRDFKDFATYDADEPGTQVGCSGIVL